MSKKFRSHIKKLAIPRDIILPAKQNKVPENHDLRIDHEFSLSETERVKYIYTHDDNQKITNIVCVSYDIYINKEWITIIFYDSEHGFLHRHETISLENRNDVITEEQVKKRGQKKDWLTWAIKDIKKRYIYYKKLFFKKCNTKFQLIHFSEVSTDTSRGGQEDL